MKNLVKVFVGYNIALALFYLYRFLFFDILISPGKVFTLFILMMMSVGTMVFVLVHDETI